MLYSHTTPDGLYRLDVTPIVTGMPPYQLLLISGQSGGKAHRLEVYDELVQANEAAAHFLRCYAAAVREGYRFDVNKFVHSGGGEAPVAAAFALDVEAFRRGLQEAKAKN